MADVNKGGVTTAGKNAKAAGPKLGNAQALREKLAEEGATSEVVFVGNCDHLYLVPPRAIHDKQGAYIGEDAGLYVDFGGVGQTRAYNPDLANDAAYVDRMREVIGAKPSHPDVVQYKIRELKEADPAPPFGRFDEYSAEFIKVTLEANFTDDHDANVARVKQAAKYEAANQNRDEVLAVLDGMLAQEAAVSDAFETTVVLK